MTRSQHLTIWALVIFVGLLFSIFAIKRFDTFHNRTFDLAFYTRMSWGLIRGDLWSPIVNGNFWGLHLSWILAPFGFLGLVFPLPQTLLVAQAFALTLPAFAIARVTHRTLGPYAVLPITCAYLLHPNFASIATDEFHPGSLAIWPWALFLERTLWLTWAKTGEQVTKAQRGMLLTAVGILLCREDFALNIAAICLTQMLVGGRTREIKRFQGFLALGVIAYFGFFLFVLQRVFAPQVGSLELHFGVWGNSPLGLVTGALSRPVAFVEYLLRPENLLLLAQLSVPLLCGFIAAPKILVGALPTLGICLASAFPASSDLVDHYVTFALLPLFLATMSGFERLLSWFKNAAPRKRAQWIVAHTILLLTAAEYHLYARAPSGQAHQPQDFEWDARSTELSQLLSLVDGSDPRTEAEQTTTNNQLGSGRDTRSDSLQGPDALLAHVAERHDVRRVPPPESGAHWVMLAAHHRDALAHREALLRVDEEPELLRWLERRDHALVRVMGGTYVFERGVPARSGLGFVDGHLVPAQPVRGIALTACLRVIRADLIQADNGESELEIRWSAAASCPNDLAIRIGHAYRPKRVDLLVKGWLSPALLEAGDEFSSRHPLLEMSGDDLSARGIRLGAVRSSGARPDPSDPMSVWIPVSSIDPDNRLSTNEGSRSGLAQ